MTTTRLERLLDALTHSQVPLVALNPGASFTYLTGLDFHLMERPVILFVSAGGKTALVHPLLESAKLAHSTAKLESFPYSDNPLTWEKAFLEAARYLGAPVRIGIEPQTLRILEYRFLETAFPGASFLDAGPVLAGLRDHKDAGEIVAMRRAVQVAQEALLAALPVVKAGVSEQAVASELTVQLLKAGSQPHLPFAPIVAAGPNSANPHATPSGRLLQSGDLLVIDWGARVDGYCSDLTRTFGIGRLDPEFESIHHIVQEANRAGVSAVAPGKSAASVDRAARSVIQAAGYGDFFIHRTGHGLGMEAHETPYIHADNNEPLAPGMTFTIEPGIYLPGRGGVRIEDNVVVSEDGMECLSDLPRALQLLG